MPRVRRWERRMLYAFFVGKLDRERQQVPAEAMADALLELYAQLRAALRGMCHLKPFEATGDTSVWGREPATVVLVLADQAEQRTTDTIIAEQAGRLRLDLLQDEVWVTKQKLGLLIARHETDEANG